jgi:hypothetical protein
MALGAATDDLGLQMILVLSHEDEATATENVTRVKTRIEGAMQDPANYPWAAGISSVETSSSGIITVVKLRGDAMPWDIILRNEPVLLQDTA